MTRAVLTIVAVAALVAALVVVPFVHDLGHGGCQPGGGLRTAGTCTDGSRP